MWKRGIAPKDVEVRISRSVSVSPLEVEITRVDCIKILYVTYKGHKRSKSNKKVEVLIGLVHYY